MFYSNIPLKTISKIGDDNGDNDIIHTKIAILAFIFTWVCLKEKEFFLINNYIIWYKLFSYIYIYILK